MRKILSYGLSILNIMGFLFGCSPSIKISSDYDRAVDFSKYRSFAIFDLKDKSDAVSALNKDRILKAVKTELSKKGFTEVSNNPDLLVNIVTVLQEKASVTSNTNYYGYGGYYRPYAWGAGMGSGYANTTYDVYNYKDGSLIIDLVDSETNKLIWHGAGNSEIDKPLKNPDIQIPEFIAKILAKYPPTVQGK